MSAIQLYTDILQQVKEIQTRLQAIEQGAQPSVPEAERLSVQLHEFQKMLAAYVFLKEHGERFVEEHLQQQAKKEAMATVKSQPVLNIKPTMVSVTQQPQVPPTPKQPEVPVQKEAFVEKQEPIVPPTVTPPKPEAIKVPEPAPLKNQEPVAPQLTVKETPSMTTTPGAKMEIGLNDKFRMINELFKSNQPEYNIAIEQLNNAASWDDARVYLNGLRLIYAWDEEHPMVKLIYQLAKKRFS